MRRSAWVLWGVCACNGGGADATGEPVTTMTSDVSVGPAGTGGTEVPPTSDAPTSVGSMVDTGDTGGTPGDTGVLDTGVLDTGDPDTGDTGDPGELGGPFGRGINMGYRNVNWGDAQMSWLSGQVGSTTARVSLPETHLDKWGYDIEVADMATYAADGMDHHIAFLIAPIPAHSTAPDGTPEWELAHFIPANLYEPAVIDGAINPANYWAAYVHDAVATYKDHVDLWEVWNEPDWIADYNFSLTWDEQPPTKEQLVRFGGSIFDYVRMLRVTREAALLADPDAKIALGGIGYPSFLNALLRYTDNPDGGQVTAEFPDTGAAYFDVLNHHYYPLWTPGNSDAGTDGFFVLRDQFAAEMQAAGAAPRPFSVTEVGAPRESFNNQPGGIEYARNFYAKVMTRAQAEGFLRADWFILSDGDPGDPFGAMGLYEDVKDLATQEEAVRTPTGVTARTHGLLLGGARVDPAATAALALPADVGGAAFRGADDRQILVLWAYAAGTDEGAVAHYDLATDRGFDVHAWDFSATDTAMPLAPQAGQIGLDLTASPVILVEQ